ncbi:hypothetical protein F0562_008770 [Nyssa sinensis]|uniref:DUF4408 domain-containing protein n=1 Tax=Nyssa sinensis TaxID=561372 RepID=A0A5J5ACT5_9ASTE|nr:hypothetical protein F0562_008770 [Nyssa sinensis]
MDKSNKSQILKLSLIAALLIITPFLPTSLRPTYLYFVFNLLIIALGAEAGLLKFFSKAAEEKKQPVVVVAPKRVVASEASPQKEGSANTSDGITTPECGPKKPKAVEKSSSEKIVGAVKVHKVKKCPSTPSLFFIGGVETKVEELPEDDEEEEDEGLSGQELFTRAETFIGNFYKQLKMQREESWKTIHGYFILSTLHDSLTDDS